MREAVVGSEAEGLYGLLRGVTSHSHLLPSQPPSKKPHHAPSTTISQTPPQESTGLKVFDPAGQATDLPLQLLSQLQRRPFQPTCNPSTSR